VKVLHAKQIATANSLVDFRDPHACYEARSLSEKDTGLVILLCFILGEVKGTED